MLICQSLTFAQEGNEDSESPTMNYIFDRPDIVAAFETLEGEVQLEAFGLRKVNSDLS